MKFLIEFFPIVLFFVAYKFGNIYLATLVAIGASLIQVLYTRFKTGRFEKIPLITLAIITVLGSATLFFRNELFIKWKPTVIYWVLALAFLLSQWIGGKPLIQRAAEQTIQLNAHIWNRLNWSWVCFFTIMGALNLYVMHYFDTDTWVNFKLFGTLTLTALFVIAQSICLMRHRPTEKIHTEK